MKKILLFNGGARVKGSTYQVLNEIERGIKEAGCTVVDYQLNKLNFKGCQGCLSCKKTSICCLNDDLKAMYEELKDADGIVFGSPIYMHAVTGQTKIWMDRLYALIDFQ